MPKYIAQRSSGIVAFDLLVPAGHSIAIESFRASSRQGSIQSPVIATVGLQRSTGGTGPFTSSPPQPLEVDSPASSVTVVTDWGTFPTLIGSPLILLGIHSFSGWAEWSADEEGLGPIFVGPGEQIGFVTEFWTPTLAQTSFYVEITFEEF